MCYRKSLSFGTFKKIINEISLEGSAESLKHCRVLQCFYKCLTIIQYDSKHVAVQSDVYLEIELCLTDAFCSLLHEHYTQRTTHNKAHTSSFNVTGWTARGSNPGGSEIFRTRPDRPWGPPNLLYNGYRVFPGVKAAGAWCISPTSSSDEIKERVELYIYSPFGPLWPVIG